MQKKLFITLLLILAFAMQMHAQDIYRLNYKSPDPQNIESYEAFFSLTASGAGIVRVKPASDRSQTVEMEFQESYAIDKEGNPDLNYVVYEGKNPKVLTGNKSTNITPITFWFKKNADNFYDPWAVSRVNEITAPAENNFLSVAFIKTQDMSKNRDLVSLFFADTSAYYQNLFGPRSRGGTLTAEEKKNTRIFLIVVASTKDTSLQPNCLLDARKVINFFKELSYDVLGLPVRNLYIDSVFGDKYSRASVETAINKIKPAKTDLVIFYYSGHGFHDKKKEEKIFPFFDLRDPTKTKFRKDLETQTMNVKDIYDTIIKKGARFNLVLSDCCNDTVAAPKIKWWEIPKKKGTPKFNIDNVRSLFFSPNKLPVNLLMTAASKDEEAIVTPSFNSYFTFFFLQALNTYLSPDKAAPAWSQVLEYSRTQTIKQVNTLPCKEKTKCPIQRPVALIPGLRL